MALINPELIKLARFTLREGWASPGAIEKVAIVPPGGGPPPPGDPGAGGGPPPGMSSPGADPAGGGGPPPDAPPGGAPGGATPGGPPPGPMDPAALQQIVMAVQQAMGGSGPGGKGKSPKDQLQASQAKIMIHLLAQVASKMGVQVDPQMLVPPSDPASDQMAMQELQNAPMMPSTDPNAPSPGPGGAAAPPPIPPGGDPSGGGPSGGDPSGGMGPGPMPPLDPGQGPIGKAAEVHPNGRLARVFDEEPAIGHEYSLARLRQNREKAAARLKMFQSLARG